MTAGIILVAPTHVRAQDYPGYPYSIMTREGGARTHHGVLPVRRHNTVADHAAATAAPQPHRPSLLDAARGSSGVVLPTPLPKTQLIPPEGGGMLTLPPLQQEQGLTRIPGTAQIVPNLPHSPETFQDRASRCTFQAGIYGVPGNLRNRYMGACVQ